MQVGLKFKATLEYSQNKQTKTGRLLEILKLVALQGYKRPEPPRKSGISWVLLIQNWKYTAAHNPRYSEHHFVQYLQSLQTFKHLDKASPSLCLHVQLK